ncbi:MAG: hypothetical protein PVI01_06395 [Gemmatimonadales bacterium]|jgi:hypothetical protein
MYRAIATLLLLAHIGALAAPALAKADPMVGAESPHCVALASHAGPGITQPSEDCDACKMPACVGMISCVRVGVGIAIIPLTSFELSPTPEVMADQETPGSLANLQPTPLSPPPKA